MRFIPLVATLVLAIVAGLLCLFSLYWLVAAVPLAIMSILGLTDLLHATDPLRRNYPLTVRFRYLLEWIGPFMRSYVVDSDEESLPFPRDIRRMIYGRSLGEGEPKPFGSELDFDKPGYTWIHHSIAAKPPAEPRFRIDIGGPRCTKPYSASVFNISAMSFGAIGANAVEALNLGARLGDFAHDTGEGGYSPYHRKHAGDIIWEIGSGYFGCRTPDGNFDPERFRVQAADDQIKMINIKLSQGAKPGHGGMLPGAKVTPEIAATRGIEPWKDCISPNFHSSFSTPVGLLEFTAQLRDLSGGKPAGFKLAIGHPWEFLAICKAMLKTGIYPDFIIIDGGEGGTGAAPHELPDHVGMPLIDALTFAHAALCGTGLRDHVMLGASGKIVSGFSLARVMALGADFCMAARSFMFSLGCVQSMRCHAGTCPTGITTQDPLRQRAIVVPTHAERVHNFHAATVAKLAEIVGAAGLDHPDELRPEHLYMRLTPNEIRSAADLYPQLKAGVLLSTPEETPFAALWELADPDRFAPKSIAERPDISERPVRATVGTHPRG
ncbi:FMN-binding glutamate synthase family protein [Emcibacter sp. SYSU 3D8]|uniref:FMN-binding glutamate synthase family protein n=1 Tax=Emcibacter sp. SYSU 3D8 TaxID=3133969 RepID=UPI0031FE4FCB